MIPPSASISLTRWPFAMPPMAGLQDICPTRSRLRVTSAVDEPSRAAAEAASQPACPAPITITSNDSSKDITYLHKTSRRLATEYPRWSSHPLSGRDTLVRCVVRPGSALHLTRHSKQSSHCLTHP